MNQEARLSLRRDWVLFGLKWLLLLLFVIGAFLSGRESGEVDPVSGLLVPVGVGVVANIVLGLIITGVPSLVPAVVVIADIVLAAVFTYYAAGDPVLIVGTAGALIFSSFLRLGPIWMALQAFGVLTAVMIVHSLTPGAGPVTSGPFVVSLLLLVGLAIMAVVGSYVLDQIQGAQERRIADLTNGETERMQVMRARSKAIYELSSSFSSTLSFDRILNAALDVGRLGLRTADSQGYVSAVLLHRAADSTLYVAASRRFTRADDTTVIRGEEGLVGQALRESVPLFANNPRKDPELNKFSAMHYCKSVLVVPLRSEFENYGVVVYGSEKPDAFDADQSDLLLAIGSQVTTALQNSVLYRSLVEEKNRIIEVEESARKKLARDLHDGPTQSVAAIAMRMSYIARLVARNPEQVEEELIKVEDLARRTAKEIRHMLFTLRPLVLESSGLTAALEQLAQKMQDTHGQAMTIRATKEVDQLLDPQQQGILFYIIEEAANNARKHAQAEMITVSVGRQGPNLVCHIADNGLGFNAHAVSAGYDKRGSLGMLNMRERAELLDGTVNVESIEGKGTIVTVTIPINRAYNAIREGESSRPRPLTKLAVAAMERVNGALG